MQKRKESYKIKRYRNIYSVPSSPRRVALRVFLLCCVIAGLGYLGWVSYDPLMAFLSQRQAAISIGGEEQLSMSEESVSSSEEIPSVSEEITQQTRGVYVPTEILLDETALDAFLAQLSNTDINSVLFDVKDQRGMVLYASSQTLVETAGTQIKPAYDLRMVVRKLEERGLKPIARMHAFRDVTAPMTLRDCAVKYMDTNTMWLDNAPEAGGKPWMNPYSTVTQAYLVDIAAEVAAAGVPHILLDSVTFPVGVGLNFAGYGENAETQTRAEVLTAFVQRVQTQIAPMGSVSSVLVTGKDALGENDQYYGTNPLSLSDSIFVDASPGEMADTEAGSEPPQDANINPYESVYMLMRTISPDLSGKGVTTLVRAYSEDGRTYSREEIMDQVRALADVDINSVVYYHPEGDYTALFF